MSDFQNGSLIERVYDYLAASYRSWVPASELSDPRVGGYRFGSCIHDLRKRGYQIETGKLTNSPQGKYRLMRKTPV